MTRKDLRNKYPKFRGADHSAPYPKTRSGLKVSTVFWILAVLIIIGTALHVTKLVLAECEGREVPRYCVD